MALAMGMKSLADDIIASYEERLRSMNKLRGDTQAARGQTRTMVHALATRRAGESTRMKQELGRDRTARASEVRNLTSGTRQMLSGLSRSRKEEETEMRTRMAQEAAARRSAVGGIISATAQAVRDFRASRKKAGDELRAELSAGVSGIKTETATLAKETQSLISEFARSHRQMCASLASGLAQSRSSRRLALNGMRGEFGRARSEVRIDLKAAAAAWETVSSPKKSASVPAAPEGDIPDLEAKLLAAVAGNPGGISLSAIAESLGVVTVVLGRAARSLLEKGKLRKEDKLYFPAGG